MERRMRLLIDSGWRFATLPSVCALLCLLAACGGSGSKPNVVFILIDTLRKDHLSVYGYERETSPKIDAIARGGWVFENHVSHASQTVPSTLSIMLSQLPAEHGFVHRRNRQFVENPPLYPDELLFLPEVLQQAGYRTAGFVANPFLKAKNGFDQGFDHFVHSRHGRDLSLRARQWIDQVAADDAPFFVYLHYMEVHAPYDPPLRYVRDLLPAEGRLLRIKNGPTPNVSPEDLEFTKAHYDGGIRYVDALIGYVLQHLEALEIDDDTLVLITADHGDEFVEHGGMGHGTTVYGELIRAPLILSYAPRFPPGRRLTHLSRHLDVAPTLLELLDVDIPTSFRGGSLFEPAPQVFAEESAWRAVHTADLKLIVDLNDDEMQLFSLDDQLDRNVLNQPESARRLYERIDDYRQLEAMALKRRQSGAEWTPEELEDLRSLGYLQ